MTISQAHDRDLTDAIRDFCGVDAAKAEELLRDAKATARSLGWPLDDVLVQLQFVPAPN